jgi:2-keto-4-pentenoate hydratase/2-oxohepta-3-ene-1,7-dioic acid hydratase in catechol pathway
VASERRVSHPFFMQPGDIFEVEIDGLGVLTNPVQDG